MTVATMHRVGTRGKGLTGLAAVWRVTRVPAVNDIARDGQDRLRMHRIAIGWMLADLLHEGGDEVSRDAVDPIIVVAILRIITRDLVGDDQSVVTADRLDLRVFDRGEAISHHRQAGDPEGHGAQDLLVV